MGNTIQKSNIPYQIQTTVNNKLGSYGKINTIKGQLSNGASYNMKYFRQK